MFSGKVNSQAIFSPVSWDLISTSWDLVDTISDLVDIYPAGSYAQLGLHWRYLPKITGKVAVRAVLHEWLVMDIRYFVIFCVLLSLYCIRNDILRRFFSIIDFGKQEDIYRQWAMEELSTDEAEKVNVHMVSACDS